MGQPLDKIKVVDFTHLLPGELTCAILCDLGTSLTRVEKLTPGLGQFLPPIVKGESLYFWSVHRDERRIGLDLKKEKSLEIVNQLLNDADILVENFRPGVMSRLGLGFGKLHKTHPRLIYCSISAYGHTTSFNQRPGHDLNLQAESGVMHVCRSPEGKPLMPGTLLSDYMTALLASVSILAAIIERDRTGKGRHLDLSMFDSILYTQALAATASLYLGEEPHEADPSYRNRLANYNVFRCKDGRFVAAAPLEPQFWSTFCQRIGREDLLRVFAFGPNDKLRTTLETEFERKTLPEWIEIFENSDCCLSPVNNVKEALDFLPAKQRNLMQDLLHPVLGRVPQLRAPLPFDKKHGGEIHANHDLAAATVAVLRSLGYSQEAIAKLAEEGIVFAKAVTA